MSIQSIQRKLAIAAITVIALVGATACNQPMSYEKASEMEPYKSLSGTDRHWLYDYRQTPAGALDWVEDELRLADDSIANIWRTSDGMLELEFENSKKFSMKRDKAVALIRAKGGPAAARELSSMAHKEVGGSALPPKEPYVLPGLSSNAWRAQLLTYPKLFQRAAIGLTQQSVEKADQLRKAGKLPAALEALSFAIEQRKAMLGDDHPATLGAKEIYKTFSGKDYVGEDANRQDDPAK